MHHPTDRIAHTIAFVTPVVEHWLEREIDQWVHPMKDPSNDPSHHERTLLPRSYISLPFKNEVQKKKKKRKKGNVLFNDALNTFSLWLNGIRHVVKDHSARGNLLLPLHGLLFLISSKESFICNIPQTGKLIPRPLLHQS